MNIHGIGKAALMSLAKTEIQDNADDNAGKDKAKLEKACADFESVLLNYMFKSMKKTVGKGSVSGNSFQKDMYESVFFEKIAEKIAQERGMGIGDALYRQLAGETFDSPKGRYTSEENDGTHKK